MTTGFDDPIQSSELHALLNDPNLFESTLDRYFDSAAFQPIAALAPGVTVTNDSGDSGKGVAGSAAVAVANRIFQRRRQAQYEGLRRERPELPRAVAEGDSWFLHPLLPDIIDQLSGGPRPRVAIRSFAAAGESLVDMWRMNRLLDAAEEESASFMLLSGGGNDLLGKHFPAFLNTWTPDTGQGVARLLNTNFGKKIAHLRSVYNQIAQDARRRLPDTALVTHCYDYVIPGSSQPTATENRGKWIGRHLDDAGVHDGEERRLLTRFVIDQFADKVLGGIAEMNNVIVVDTRCAVGSHEWHDEIHPNAIGFNSVALRVLALVEEL